MNISKHIRLLVLVLAPICLLCMERSSNNWVHVALSSKQVGFWLSADKQGKTVIVEGEMISPENHRVISSEADLKNLAAMFADVLLPSNVELENTFAVAWLYSKIRGLLSWKNTRDRIYDSSINQISHKNLQQDAKTAYIFTVSEPLTSGGKSLLGSALFCLNNGKGYEEIELALFAVKPAAQGRGLGTILASSIFKFLPQTKHIFLDAICTNRKAHVAYEAMGFKRYENRHADLNFVARVYASYCVDYEYLTDKCQRLQDVAAKFKEIEN